LRGWKRYCGDGFARPALGRANFFLRFVPAE